MEEIVTICENREFRRIYAQGKSYVSPVIVVYAVRNRRKQVRVGITTTKKIGNAVKRSRSRRIIREAFRQVAPEIPRGWSFILVARVKTGFVKTPQVEKELRGCLKKAGILPAGKPAGTVHSAGKERKEIPSASAKEVTK